MSEGLSVPDAGQSPAPAYQELTAVALATRYPIMDMLYSRYQFFSRPVYVLLVIRNLHYSGIVGRPNGLVDVTNLDSSHYSCTLTISTYTGRRFYLLD
jgi:hypothetical protein